MMESLIAGLQANGFHESGDGTSTEAEESDRQGIEEGFTTPREVARRLAGVATGDTQGESPSARLQALQAKKQELESQLRTVRCRHDPANDEHADVDAMQLFMPSASVAVQWDEQSDEQRTNQKLKLLKRKIRLTREKFAQMPPSKLVRVGSAWLESHSFSHLQAQLLGDPALRGGALPVECFFSLVGGQHLGQDSDELDLFFARCRIIKPEGSTEMVHFAPAFKPLSSSPVPPPSKSSQGGPGAAKKALSGYS